MKEHYEKSIRFQGKHTGRVIVIGGPSPSSGELLSEREARICSQANKRTYVGLIIGVAVALLLLWIAFVAE